MTIYDRRTGPYPTTPSIGALLRMPWDTVRARMLEGLHARGFTDLTAAHLNVFQYPGPIDLRPSELAERTHMSKQALSYLLGQLQQLGYLTRRPDPDDHRARRVALTPRGEAAVASIPEIVREVEQEWEQRIGTRRLDLLRELLIELQDHTADPRSTR